MPRWLIRLGGDRLDLQDLERELGSGSFLRVFRRDEYYYLEVLHETFETAQQVHDYAESALLPALNGLMRVRYPDFRNVEVDAIGQEKEDGSISHYVFVRASAEAKARCRASVTVVKANGTVICDTPESLAAERERWLQVLQKDKRCLEAFRLYAAKPYDWVTLYKIYEIVESDGAPITNWVSEKQVKRFTHTANSPEAVGLENARHGKQHHLPPPRPMSIQEATRLIGIILERWVEEKSRLLSPRCEG